MRTTLFEQKTPNIWIKIEIYINEDKNLVVHGCDSGKVVKQLKQRDDYEYYVTIKEKEIPQLKSIIGVVEDNEMIDWFQQNFSTNSAVSDIREELTRLKVKHQFFTW